MLKKAGRANSDLLKEKLLIKFLRRFNSVEEGGKAQHLPTDVKRNSFP